MRDQVIQKLAEMFNNNLGNRITPELATGFMALISQIVPANESEDQGNRGK